MQVKKDERGRFPCGPTLTYFSNTSQSQELANVEDAISKKVDGILMYAVSLSAESADVAKANAANIPIFLLYGYEKNMLPRVAGFEQVDLIHCGKEVGTWLTKHLTTSKTRIPGCRMKAASKSSFLCRC
jgi:ABC-type sugar transport system substrate-binding protein